MNDGTLDDRKLSKNIFEFDEGWEENRRGNCGTWTMENCARIYSNQN